MALNFPTAPSLNQEYTSGDLTYRWNGSSWTNVLLSTPSYATQGYVNEAINQLRIDGGDAETTF